MWVLGCEPNSSPSESTHARVDTKSDTKLGMEHLKIASLPSITVSWNVCESYTCLVTEIAIQTPSIIRKMRSIKKRNQMMRKDKRKKNTKKQWTKSSWNKWCWVPNWLSLIIWGGVGTLAKYPVGTSILFLISRQLMGHNRRKDYPTPSATPAPSSHCLTNSSTQSNFTSILRSNHLYSIQEANVGESITIFLVAKQSHVKIPVGQ